MDPVRLRVISAAGNVVEGGLVCKLRVLDVEKDSQRLLKLNEILSLHRDGFPISNPIGYARYEVHLVAPEEVLVTFHLAGQLTHTSCLTINLGRPVSDIKWLEGTINGLFPSARALLSTGIDESALSAYRKILHFKVDPPPAMKGCRKPGEDHREVFIAFGMSHLGHVIDLRPCPSLKSSNLKAVVHKFGDWSVTRQRATEVLS